MGLCKVHHQTPHEIDVRYAQLLGLELELLILNGIVSDQDRSLYVIKFPTWVFHIYSLKILHPGHKLGSYMCADF